MPGTRSTRGKKVADKPEKAPAKSQSRPKTAKAKVEEEKKEPATRASRSQARGKSTKSVKVEEVKPKEKPQAAPKPKTVGKKRNVADMTKDSNTKAAAQEPVAEK